MADGFHVVTGVAEVPVAARAVDEKPVRAGRGRRGAHEPATKKEQREASIEALLAAALRLFTTQGYHATTVDQIAREAGLTKGAVYFYFKSKATVLDRLLDRVEELCVEPCIAAVVRAGAAPRDQLVAFMHAQSLIGAERADLMLLAILAGIEFDRTGDAVEARLDRMFGRMAEALTRTLQAGRADGAFRADLNVREMVSVIMALNEGCLLEWYRNRTRLDGPGVVRAMRTMLLDGFTARPANRSE